MPSRKRLVVHRTRLVAASAVAVLTAACGQGALAPTRSPPSSGPATTVTTTPPGGTPPCGVAAGPGVTVTGPPEPCSASAHVGATLSVVLDAGFDWSTPTSDSSAVDVADVRRRSTGTLTAELLAARAGRATVSAVGTVRCAPGQACPALALRWQLRVTVVP
ncbi:MAG: hypothetical protein ACLQPH_20615 [Acidimicrobiales bacterium]